MCVLCVRLFPFAVLQIYARPPGGCSNTILCLTLRTTVTSARILENGACHRARILCVFSRVQKGTPGLTHKGCVLQRVSVGALSDVTVVLGMRQSIDWDSQSLYTAAILENGGPNLYFVSSRERPWRHWARPMIHAARRILYASISVFLFERVRKHTSYARDDKRLCLEYALTSRSFSGWDKV